MDEPIILPLLLYIICALSAISFVVSSGLWFYKKQENSFQKEILIGQAQGFVWAMIISIALGQSFDIIGEVLVLGVALFFGYKYIQETLIFGGLCFIGWIITAFVGTVLFFLSGDLTFAVFVAGLLWLAPVFVFYRRMPADKKVYNFLWPVMCAYLVLLLPLMIQKNINTDEWKERQYARPLRKA